MAKTINISDIKALVFEGGGGKGIAYVGAIEALEKRVYEGNIPNEHPQPPLFDLTNQNVQTRPLQAVAGSSAGAITAFLLSIGYNSTYLNNLFNWNVPNPKSAARDKNEDRPWDYISKFETFLTDPEPNLPPETKVTKSPGTLRTFDKTGNPDVHEIQRPLKDGETRSAGNTRIAQEKKQFQQVVTTATNLLGHKLLGPLFVSEGPTNWAFRMIFLNSQAGLRAPIQPSRDTGPLKRSHYPPDIYKPNYYDLVPFSQYAYSLLHDFGLFKGETIRPFLAEVLKHQLEIIKVQQLSNISETAIMNFIEEPGKTTFLDLYNLTKVELVVTGTNITQGRGLYFSHFHTPNFPVIDAVIISMSFPFAFKPYYLEGDVNSQENKEYNDLYRGLWVDGGMANNLPLHAFDFLEKGDYKGLSNSQIKLNNILALRLTSGTESNTVKDYTPESYSFIRYITDMLNTLMFPSEEGILKTDEERNQTIELFCEEIDVLDFSNPRLDDSRQRYAKNGHDTLAKMKDRVISNAYESVLERVKKIK